MNELHRMVPGGGAGYCSDYDYVNPFSPEKEKGRWTVKERGREMFM